MNCDRDGVFAKYHLPETKDGFIGSHMITYREVVDLLLKMTKNYFYNLTHTNKRFLKIWAITDNRNNYDIYIE